MSQEQLILNYLKPMGRRIDPVKALRLFKCFRLASRINSLRKSHNIKSDTIRNKRTGKHYSSYYLA